MHLNYVKGFTFLFDFMVLNDLSVLDHKKLLREDLKDELKEDIPVER